MKLIVFGATGGTGRAVIEQALDAGHTVTALARHINAFPVRHDRLTAVSGDILDAASLAPLIAGHDAVLSTVGTESRKPTTLFSAGATNTIAAMRASGMRRLIVVSASAITPASPALGIIYLYNRVIGPLLFGNQYADMRRMEAIVQASDTDWTIVRPSRLTNGPRTDHYRRSTGRLQRGMLAISRADVAAFMLACLTDAGSIRQAIAVAY